jgi:hypothetical protein
MVSITSLMAAVLAKLEQVLAVSTLEVEVPPLNFELLEGLQ